MTTTELFSQLTEKQKKEFSKDVQQLIQQVKSSGYLKSNKVFETNGNMRLDDDKVLLNVSLLFQIEENDEVVGSVTEIKRFDTIDEYLDSINDTNNSNQNDWIKLR